MAINSMLELIDEETDRLFAFIRSRVSNEEDSWDILQDVFLAFYSRWNLGEVFEDVVAWLFSVARNKIVDLYRRRTRGEISLEELCRGSEENGYLIDLIGTQSSDPEQEFRRVELRQLLIEAINELSPEQREVFLLTELHGKKFSEISEKTGVPLNTLLSRKRYAIQKLRKRISGVLQYHER